MHQTNSEFCHNFARNASKLLETQITQIFPYALGTENHVEKRLEFSSSNYIL